MLSSSQSLLEVCLDFHQSDTVLKVEHWILTNENIENVISFQIIFFFLFSFWSRTTYQCQTTLVNPNFELAGPCCHTKWYLEEDQLVKVMQFTIKWFSRAARMFEMRWQIIYKGACSIKVTPPVKAHFFPVKEISKILPVEIELVISFIKTFLRFKFNSTERIPARELVLTSTVDRRLLINSPRVLEALSVSNVTTRWLLNWSIIPTNGSSVGYRVGLRLQKQTIQSFFFISNFPEQMHQETQSTGIDSSWRRRILWFIIGSFECELVPNDPTKALRTVVLLLRSKYIHSSIRNARSVLFSTIDKNATKWISKGS